MSFNLVYKACVLKNLELVLKLFNTLNIKRVRKNLNPSTYNNCDLSD